MASESTDRYSAHRSEMASESSDRYSAHRSSQGLSDTETVKQPGGEQQVCTRGMPPGEKAQPTTMAFA